MKSLSSETNSSKNLVSDMAFFLLHNNGPSSSIRVFMLALFALVLACSFSYCSSSPTYSVDPSTIDIGDNNIEIEKKSNDQNYPYYRSAFESSPSTHDMDVAERPISSKHRFVNLLTKAALLEAEDRPHRQYPIHANNRRYAAQSFHAMRG
jgi:hypothetical protein